MQLAGQCNPLARSGQCEAVTDQLLGGGGCRSLVILVLRRRLPEQELRSMQQEQMRNLSLFTRTGRCCVASGRRQELAEKGTYLGLDGPREPEQSGAAVGSRQVTQQGEKVG